MSDLKIVGVAATPSTNGVVVRLGFEKGMHRDIEFPLPQAALLASLLLVSLSTHQPSENLTEILDRFSLLVPATELQIEGSVVFMKIGPAWFPVDFQTDVVEQFARTLVALEEAKDAEIEERIREAVWQGNSQEPIA